MILARLFPLLLLAACSRAPDYSGCRLVGTWKSAVRSTGPTRVEEDTSHVAGGFHVTESVTTSWTDSRDGDEETFRPDGVRFISRAVLTGNNETRHDHAQSQWNLIEDHGSRVVVDVCDPLSPDSRTTRCFEFESSETMHEVGGMFDGVKYTRITPAQ